MKNIQKYGPARYTTDSRIRENGEIRGGTANQALATGSILADFIQLDCVGLITIDMARSELELERRRLHQHIFYSSLILLPIVIMNVILKINVYHALGCTCGN